MNRNDLTRLFKGKGKEINVHQLNEPVSMLIQGQFYLYNKELREQIGRGHITLDEEDIINRVTCIAGDKEVVGAELKRALSELSCTESPRALRVVDELLETLQGEARSWALMAQLELRMRIVGNLVEESQIILSSGLGGRGFLVRLNGYCLNSNLSRWQDYQRELLHTELAYTCSKIGGEVEQELWGEEYFIFTILLPYDVDIQSTLQSFIERCNEFGGFIHPDCHVTNMDVFEHEAVQRQIRQLRARRAGATKIENLTNNQLLDDNDGQ